VEHVRRRANARYGLSVEGVTQDATDILVDHDWPGNVRELEAVVEQAMIFRREGWVSAGDLVLRSQALPPGRASTSAPGRGMRLAGERVRAALRPETAIRLVVAQGSVTSGDLAVACGVSGEQARRELLKLTQLGRLRRLGRGRTTRHVRG